MVTRTFLSKCTSIFAQSEDNFGLNPILMLNYGKQVSRALIYFDIDKIKNATEGGYNKETTKHFLKMTNCGSIDYKNSHKKVPASDISGEKDRASSFNLIFFKIPQTWDAGVGFDSSSDYWLIGKSSVSQSGSNWYQSYNGKSWDNGDGIYSNEYLTKEYDKWHSGEESIIIGVQRFDRGNEDISIDITEYINSILYNGEINYGIGIAFSPILEKKETKSTQYVGFFTNNTNTFFEPYVETRCSEAITDDRMQFYLGKDNKLYFYANIGGIPTDLDTLPKCTIGNAVVPVKRQKKGVYYAEVKLDKKEYSNDEIIYDIWSNIVYNGQEFEDIEMEFTTHSMNNFFRFGDDVPPFNVEPSISGINDNESINQGDDRLLNVMFRIPYSSEYELLNNAQYRLYIKDGEREISVIDWDNIDTIAKSNSFIIKTSDLLPAEYFVDIKAKTGKTERMFKDILHFRVVNNATVTKK